MVYSSYFWFLFVLCAILTTRKMNWQKRNDKNKFNRREKLAWKIHDMNDELRAQFHRTFVKLQNSENEIRHREWDRKTSEESRLHEYQVHRKIKLKEPTGKKRNGKNTQNSTSSQLASTDLVCCWRFTVWFCRECCFVYAPQSNHQQAFYSTVEWKIARTTILLTVSISNLLYAYISIKCIHPYIKSIIDSLSIIWLYVGNKRRQTHTHVVNDFPRW